MTTYGYVRVSSTDQNEDRQMIALRQKGVEDKHIFHLRTTNTNGGDGTHASRRHRGNNCLGIHERKDSFFQLAVDSG